MRPYDMETDVLSVEDSTVSEAVSVDTDSDEVTTDTGELVSFYEDYLLDHITSIENALFLQIFGSALICGCLIATLVLQFFVRK